MKNKISPQPWKVNGHGEIVDADGSSIAIITGYGRTIDQMLTDAELMAAAPELLQGLKDVFAMMDGEVIVRNTDDDLKPEWALKVTDMLLKLKAARDAMAKAERQR